MNYLKHSLHNISMLITDARAKGDVECIDHICTDANEVERIIGTIYEKEDVGVYIAEVWDWWGNGDDEYYDGYTFLYAKGIPEEDLRTIEKTVQQMLSVRRQKGG